MTVVCSAFCSKFSFGLKTLSVPEVGVHIGVDLVALVRLLASEKYFSHLNWLVCPEQRISSILIVAHNSHNFNANLIQSDEDKVILRVQVLLSHTRSRP